MFVCVVQKPRRLVGEEAKSITTHIKVKKNLKSLKAEILFQYNENL